MQNQIDINDHTIKKINDFRKRCNMPYLLGYDYKVENQIIYEQLSVSELHKKGLIVRGSDGFYIKK